MRSCGLFLIGLMLALPVWSQQKVDATNFYHRVIAIVPVIGKGTGADPKRPMFVPVSAAATDRSAIIAFQQESSDDGTLAIVEFVAANRAALLPILTSTNPLVTAFEVGKNPRAVMEPAIQAVRKGFTFDNFQPLRVR